MDNRKKWVTMRGKVFHAAHSEHQHFKEKRTMRNVAKLFTLLTMLAALLAMFGCGGGGGGGGGGAPTVAGPGDVVSGYTLQAGETGLSGAAFLSYSSLSNQTFGWGKQLGPYGTISFGDKSVRTGTYTSSSPATNVTMTWSVTNDVITVNAATTPATVFIYTQLAINTADKYYVMMKTQTNASGASVFVDYERWYVGAGGAAAAQLFATTVTAFVPDLVAGKKLQYINVSAPLWTGTTDLAPAGVAVDPPSVLTNRGIYVVNSRANSVMKFDALTGTLLWTGNTDPNPMGVAVDASGGIYVVNSNQNLVQQITVQKFTTASALPIGAGTITLGTTGTFPNSIAVDASGAIYVTCSQSNTLQKFNQPLGNPSAVPPQAPTPPTWVVSTGLNPNGVAVDTTGGVYVANYASNTVQKFDAAAGALLWTGTTSSGPDGVAVDASGGIYVACANANAVQKFSAAAGALLWTGTTGSMPSSVVVDTTGGVYVTCANAGTVQKFTPPATAPVWTGNTGLVPSSVAVDTSGGIFVTSASSDTVQKFTVTGVTTVFTFFANTTFSYTMTTGTAGAGSWVINSDGTLTLNYLTPVSSTTFTVLPGSTTSVLILNAVNSDGTTNTNITMTYI
jgi:sugar lactone lactonase YvrE